MWHPIHLQLTKKHVIAASIQLQLRAFRYLTLCFRKGHVRHPYVISLGFEYRSCALGLDRPLEDLCSTWRGSHQVAPTQH